MKYLPFLNGTYSTAPGLAPLHREEHHPLAQVFMIDDLYDHTLANKQVCRDEDIRKYYLEYNCGDTLDTVNKYIASTVALEHPLRFTFEEDLHESALINHHTGKAIRWRSGNNVIDGEYVSAFDALCSQVQEDVAVFRLEDDRNWLAAIHLCAPNHWDPADKVGKDFAAVHAPVPGMERTLKHYATMLSTVVEKGPYTRFAWGIATDTRLNHHPQAPDAVDDALWYGRKAEKDKPKFYIRSERQNLIGFPTLQAFIFTIRTYFYDVDTLDHFEKAALLAAVNSMTPATRAYKGLNGNTDLLMEKLRSF